jgi:hypothetical protein
MLFLILNFEVERLSRMTNIITLPYKRHCMKLLNYIVIKDLKATEVPLLDNTIEALCDTNDYVIEKLDRSTIQANHDYQYKIFQRNQEVPGLDVGKWKLKNIRSESRWTPTILFFELVDPTGRSSADKVLPYSWINNNRSTSMEALGTGALGFNRMLSLAKEAAKHTYWLSFIKTTFASHVAAEHIARYSKLEHENERLTEKLNCIKKIIKD